MPCFDIVVDTWFKLDQSDSLSQEWETRVETSSC